MEKISSIPYTKLTTKEIGKLDTHTGRMELLKVLDRSIYGGLVDSAQGKELKSLEEQAKISFQEKLKKLKHG